MRTPAPVRPRRLRRVWYPLVVVLSLGFLSFVPFVHTAGRTGRRVDGVVAVLYTAAVTGTVFGLPSDLGGPVMIGLICVAAPHSLVVSLRRPVPVDAPADPAVFGALQARERRTESRRLAATDPLLAHDLRVGRPDLPRTYDDGGLVDLNGAPAEVIAGVCGIGTAVAAQIVHARTAGPTFTTVDDALTFADIPYQLWDRIRDRAVVISG